MDQVTFPIVFSSRNVCMYRVDNFFYYDKKLSWTCFLHFTLLCIFVCFQCNKVLDCFSRQSNQLINKNLFIRIHLWIHIAYPRKCKFTDQDLGLSACCAGLKIGKKNIFLDKYLTCIFWGSLASGFYYRRHLWWSTPPLVCLSVSTLECP